MNKLNHAAGLNQAPALIPTVASNHGQEPVGFPARHYHFECYYPHTEQYCVGQFTLMPFSLVRDSAAVHRWVNMDYARYWGMQGSSVDDVTYCYQKLCANEAVYAGFYNGELAFLVELYDPQRDLLRYYYPCQRGDLGMHILLAPAAAPVRNFSRTVFITVMHFLFALPQVQRIVVEPDARNEKIHSLNRIAGFVYHQRLYLPHKIAWLASASRADFFAATAQVPITQLSLSSVFTADNPSINQRNLL